MPETQKQNIYQKFCAELGYTNATNQYVELAMRKFSQDYEKEINRDLQALAETEQLKVSELPEAYNVRIAKSYIVSCYSCLDRFLIAYKDLPGSCMNTKRGQKQDGESLLEWTWRISGSNAPENINNAYLICDFYRLARDRIVHKGGSDNKYRMRFHSVQEICDGFLDAPNDVEKFTFDDQVLFSRFARRFVEYLFKCIPYDLDTVLKENADTLYQMLKSNQDIKDKNRNKKKIEMYLRSQYPKISIPDYAAAWEIIKSNVAAGI